MSQHMDLPHVLNTIIAVFQATGGDETSVGHEHVDGSVVRFDRRHHGDDGGLVANVEGDARSPDGGGHACGAGLV